MGGEGCKLCLSSLQLEDSNIKIIIWLDTYNAQGQDNISIRMLKTCDLAIIKPLSVIKIITKRSTFPDIWRESNICPVDKKEDKQVINKYRLVSLLLFYGKIFERLISNSVFKHFEKHKLLSAHQSCFWSNNSSVNQCLHVLYNI